MKSTQVITAPKADAITPPKVIDSSSACGASHTNTMEPLKEIAFNLRPEVEAVLSAKDYWDRLAYECCTCKNKATLLVTYISSTGKKITAQFCDECYCEDELWIGREIINTEQI